MKNIKKLISSEPTYEVTFDVENSLYEVTVMRNCGDEIICIINSYQKIAIISYCQSGLDSICNNKINSEIVSLTHYIEGGSDLSSLENTSNIIHHIGLIYDASIGDIVIEGKMAMAKSLLIKSNIAKRIKVAIDSLTGFKLCGSTGVGGLLDLTGSQNIKTISISGGVNKLRTINITGLSKLETMSVIATRSLRTILLDNSARRIKFLAISGISLDAAIQLSGLLPQILSLWDVAAFKDASEAAVHYNDCIINEDFDICNRANSILNT